MSPANNNQTFNTDVLITGAGPAGLMLACQLAMYGVSFRIIDKNQSPAKSSGALIIQARSLEIFETMGIAEDAIDSGIIARKVNILLNNGKMASLDVEKMGGTLSKFPFLLMLEQSITEQLFLDFLSKYGFSVERNTKLLSFNQDGRKVAARILLPEGNEELVVSRFIIAADGANSTIRNILNIPFKGKIYSKPLYILDCKANADFRQDEIYFSFSANYAAGLFPLKGSRWRIDGILPEELISVKNISSAKIERNIPFSEKLNLKSLESEWFSVFHSQQKYAKSIRFQNCFLIGDAAHVHTPVAAQGMNTGLQDAFNLGWKLAFVTKQKGSPVLLDSYTKERQWISRDFAAYADFIFQMITRNNILLKFIRMKLLNSFIVFLFHLFTKRSAFLEKFFKSVSQININYRKSNITYRTNSEKFLREAPLPGDRIPFLRFNYNGKLTNSFEILDPGSFTLIIFSDKISNEIEEIAMKYKVPIILLLRLQETTQLYSCFGIRKEGYYLIRPDHHIAMRFDSSGVSELKVYFQLFFSERK